MPAATAAGEVIDEFSSVAPYCASTFGMQRVVLKQASLQTAARLPL